MERFGETAQNIINELHTERLDYYSEYLPLINAANQLVDFEGFDRTPEELSRDLADLAAYRKAEADGELVRVVRCKDCKYLGDSFGTSGVNCKKGVFMGLHSKKRFCSCGERRYAE